MRVLLALGGNAMTNADGRARPEDQIAAAAGRDGGVADLVAAGRRRGGHPRQRPPGRQPAGQERARRGRRAPGAAGLVRRADPGDARLRADERARRRAGRAAASTGAAPTRGHPDPAWTPTTPGFTTPDQADRPVPARPRRPRCSSSTARPGRTAARRAGAASSPRPSRCEILDAAGRARAGRGRLRGRRQRRRRHPGRRARTAGCAASRPSSTRTSAPRCWPASVDADVLVIATDVPARRAALRHPRGRAASAGSTVAEMRALAAEGHFASGSMGPKVDAACRFVEQGGAPRRDHQPGPHRRRRDRLPTGSAGTVVVPELRRTTRKEHPCPSAIEVRKVPIHSVADASELAELIDDGVMDGRPGDRDHRQDRGQRRGQRLHPDHRRPGVPRGAGRQGRRTADAGQAGPDRLVRRHRRRDQPARHDLRHRPTPSRPTSRG